MRTCASQGTHFVSDCNKITDDQKKLIYRYFTAFTEKPTSDELDAIAKEVDLSSQAVRGFYAASTACVNEVAAMVPPGAAR